MNRRALTLIEVLVSISVLSVLLFILLPVVGAVRDRAGSVTCAARLSGVYTATASYASDHKGFLPTFEYHTYPDGLAQALPVPEWLEEGGWTILPFSETTFWAYQLRDHIVDDPVRQHQLAIESMSCPTLYPDWLAHTEEHEAANEPINPMWPMQQSFMKSIALFTEPSAWNDRAVPPDINRVHAAVLMSAVRSPSAKTFLVERTSFHDHEPIDLISRRPGSRFNLLAVDGHVSIKKPGQAAEPHGFIAAGTGLESPLVDPDRWREIGIPFLSTHRGARGHDW